jgi:hypothetical protein
MTEGFQHRRSYKGTISNCIFLLLGAIKINNDNILVCRWQNVEDAVFNVKR